MIEENLNEDELKDVIESDDLKLDLSEDDSKTFASRTLIAVKDIVMEAANSAGLKAVIVTDKHIDEFSSEVKNEVYKGVKDIELKNLLNQGIVILYDDQSNELLNEYNKMMFNEFIKYENLIYLIDFNSNLVEFVDSLKNVIINSKKGCFNEFNNIYKDKFNQEVVW